MHRKKQGTYRGQYYPWLQAFTEGLRTHPSWLRLDYYNWTKGNGGFHQAAKPRRFFLAEESAWAKTDRCENVVWE